MYEKNMKTYATYMHSLASPRACLHASRSLRACLNASATPTACLHASSSPTACLYASTGCWPDVCTHWHCRHHVYTDQPSLTACLHTLASPTAVSCFIMRNILRFCHLFCVTVCCDTVSGFALNLH